MLRQLKLLIASRFFTYHSAQSIPNVHSRFLWSLNKVEKFDNFHMHNDTFRCPHSIFFSGSISSSEYQALCAILFYSELLFKIKACNCQVEVILYPLAYLANQFFLAASRDYNIKSRASPPPPGIWYNDKILINPHVFPTGIPMFTILVTNSKLFNAMTEINSLPQFFRDFYLNFRYHCLPTFKILLWYHIAQGTTSVMHIFIV